MKYSLLLSFAASLVLSSGSATAKEPGGCELVYSGTATMEGSNRTKYLKIGDYQKLDASLEKQWVEHKKGRRSDLMITRDLYELVQLSGRDLSLFQEWAEKNPNSFFAILAYANYLTEEANTARGFESASRTSQRQLAAMRDIQKRATRHLDVARKIRPDAALPYTSLIVMAATQEGSAAVAPLLQTANKLDHKNLSARVAAMSYLEPRWGGSFDLVEGVITEAQQARLPDGHIDYLRYHLVMTKASHFESIMRDKPAARQLYRDALRMCGNSEGAEAGIGRTGR